MKSIILVAGSLCLSTTTNAGTLPKSEPIAATPMLAGLQLAHDAEALRQTDPTDLTLPLAAEHLTAARVAAREFKVDPNLLLAIAWHESRYTIARTAEPGGLVSCGVMTPEPMPTCSSSSIEAGYRAGAKHLRAWLDACHNRTHCALIGYAGGYKLLGECAKSPVIVIRVGHKIDLCRTDEVFLGRARWIATERVRPRLPRRNVGA